MDYWLHEHMPGLERFLIRILNGLARFIAWLDERLFTR